VNVVKILLFLFVLLSSVCWLLFCVLFVSLFCAVGAVGNYCYMQLVVLLSTNNSHQSCIRGVTPDDVQVMSEIFRDYES
jgi:hypothetical protein